MNYSLIYDSLILKRQNNILPANEYSEKHHIIPRCMGGSNDPINIVKLTAEEHRVAHMLLAKIYPTNFKIVSAAIFMCSGNIKARVPLKVYGWLRRMQAKCSRQKILRERVCPHCKKVGRGGAMIRFHFENCILIKPRTASPIKGKPISPQALLKRIGRPGVNNGKKFTTEQRENMSRSRTGKPQPWTSINLKNRHINAPDQVPSRQKVSCCSCKKVFNIVSFGKHVKTCEQHEAHRLTREMKGLKSRQWNNPSPRRGVLMSEVNKQKLRKPKSTTENMKKPKSAEAIAKMRELWKDPIKRQIRLEKRMATLQAKRLTNTLH